VRWGRELRATNLAFGQGLMVSPLALAAAYGALANEGRWIAPRIVLEPALAYREPELIVPPEYARLVIRGLVQAGRGGHWQTRAAKGLLGSGKNGHGTESYGGRARLHHKASISRRLWGLCLRMPPRAVILVLADEPRNGYYGGEVAAPAFRQVAQFLMWYWRLPPSRREATRSQPAIFNPRTRAG
jgi:cell division protein FtsI (penicillin-binding protein 3)